MFRDPFLLVPTRARSSDSADGLADLLNCLAFLGLGREREVGVIAREAEDSGDDEISGEAGRVERIKLRPFQARKMKHTS